MDSELAVTAATATPTQQRTAPAAGPLKLEVEDVGIGYFSQRHGSFFEAVRSLTFNVPDDSLVALVGPTGCGKSTFLRSVCGLLGYQHGRLLVDGSAVTGPRADCSVVFQSPALMPWRTVERNVGYGLELRGTPKAEVRDRVGHMLDMVGLSKFAEHYPHQLSGGMQQRANLARALANDPVLLLMDEPFSALDPQTRDRLSDELLRIRELTKLTVLMVTHQVDEAVLLADQCVVLSRGPGSVVEGVMDIPLGRGRTVDETRHQSGYGPLVRQLRDMLRALEPAESASGGR
ncbi:ABC transporter ATP-binding protein [Rugosimonospora acidiphila]|uniref:ABC transporter ATP-binding protein n=1 Tax=Rugosimonospora acidiphila TaxID=556531 RepID=A0ABP9S3J6_9ACTN